MIPYGLIGMVLCEGIVVGVEGVVLYEGQVVGLVGVVPYEGEVETTPSTLVHLHYW